MRSRQRRRMSGRVRVLRVHAQGGRTTYMTSPATAGADVSDDMLVRRDIGLAQVEHGRGSGWRDDSSGVEGGRGAVGALPRRRAGRDRRRKQLVSRSSPAL
ncbi:MAG: hypothetical protein M3O70_02220 [Actinomycetota bacterium]|nr:hypothetical protein [Actinomycetota bacterium]